MKKFFFVALAVLFLAGCGAAARESGYYEHSTLYKDCKHLQFSICGYPHINEKDVLDSKKGNWWGLEVEGSRNK